MLLQRCPLQFLLPRHVPVVKLRGPHAASLSSRSSWPLVPVEPGLGAAYCCSCKPDQAAVAVASPPTATTSHSPAAPHAAALAQLLQRVAVVACVSFCASTLLPSACHAAASGAAVAASSSNPIASESQRVPGGAGWGLGLLCVGFRTLGRPATCCCSGVWGLGFGVHDSCS